MVDEHVDIIAIIQARLGSTRLPGKVLLEIESKPVLQHIVNRLKKVSKIDKVIVATSKLEINSKITSYCKKNNIDFFVGSEDNVLDRFFNAAKACKPNDIIRITGDCPLVDPETIEKLIDYYKLNNYDYCGVATGAGVADNNKIFKFPDGLDAEIFKYSVIKKAHMNASKQIEKEHVTPYIWSNPSLFNLGVFESDIDYSKYRLTLDNIEDFNLIKWIYSNLYKEHEFFSLKDIIQLIEKNKYKLNTNKHLIGKEGYEIFSKKRQ